MVFAAEREWHFVPGQHHLVPGVFTAEECARIIQLHEARNIHQIVSRNSQGSYRSTDVFWLSGKDPAFNWIFKRMTEVSLEFNSQTYQFELDGCSDLQLGRYGPDQHYDWHCDLGKDGYSRRKLSVSILLSDPNHYTGGGLEFGVDIYKTTARPGLGEAVFFASWAPHRVVPVTKGERWSLVAWWLGPPFR